MTSLIPRLRAAYLYAEKNFVNRMVRLQLDLGVAPAALALLETTGRRSGTRRRVPVGNGLLGETFWLIAERGEQADYVRNIQAHPRVRVKVAGEWRTGTATIMPEDDTEERVRRILRHHGLLRRADAALLRASIRAHGSTPITVRIDLDQRQAQWNE